MSTTDRATYLPTTHDIRDAFADEITALGGSVADVHQDGERLYARAVLPAQAEVRPGDYVRAGVAVRTAGPEILVHPYTLRQVCTNGAIAAHAVGTRRVERPQATEVYAPTYEASLALNDFRLAVQACAADEAFAAVTREMRSATEQDAGFTLQMASLIARLGERVPAHWARVIFERFMAEQDRSVFGLMQAVTAVARGVRDPEMRWRLEVLGGTMPARLTPKPKTPPAAAAPADV
jgi:hypothetical protein